MGMTTVRSAPARTFRDLGVWRKAHELVLAIYELTATFPKYELYGLASQMRKAAVSVPANIAEGFRKRTNIDKLLERLEEVSRLLHASASGLLTTDYFLEPLWHYSSK